MNNKSKLALAACAVGFSAAAAAAPEVDVFSPQGEAKGVRQVAVRFTEAMVAFGDPRLPDPFDVKCEGDAAKLKGTGRWADARNWAYDFEADLPAGQKCTFTLKQGGRQFQFHTGGPAVMTSLPREGDERIDDEQWFLLAFDAPVDEASLERDGWCEASGVNEKIPLKLLSESEKAKLVEANKERAFNLYNVYIKGRRRIPIARFKIEDKRWKELPVVGVRCARRLPAGAEAGVVIGAQVKTRSGLERGAEQRLAFGVRPAFQVKFTCERANRDAACLPVAPMRLEFNAPVPREKAEGIRLKQAGRWSGIEPKLEPNAKTVEGVEFPGPFPESTRYTIELPRGFGDDAGREPENKASFPLEVGTDENPPLAKFPGLFGILELNAEPLLPVTVRGVEAPSIPGKMLRLQDEQSIVARYREFLSGWHQDNARPGERMALATADKAQSFGLTS